MTAPRVAVSWAGDASAKAVRKAIAAGLALFKTGGCANLAIAAVGFNLEPEHVVAVVRDALIHREEGRL